MRVGTDWIDPLYEIHRRHRLGFFGAAMWVSCIFVMTVLELNWPVVGDLLRETAFFTIVGGPLFVGAFVGFEVAAARNRREGVTRSS